MHKIFGCEYLKVIEVQPRTSFFKNKHIYRQLEKIFRKSAHANASQS